MNVKTKVKRILAISLSLIMVLMIAACAPTARKPEATTTEAPEETTTEAPEETTTEAPEETTTEAPEETTEAEETEADATTAEDEEAETEEDEEEPAVASDEEYHIDVILKTTASEYWGYVEAGALAYMADNPNVTVSVKGAPSETAYDDQLNLIETDLSSDEYDAYVISPLQADMVANLIKDSDKPIIAVDTRIESDKILSFVGTGNLEAAKLGGIAAVEAAEAAGWEEIQAIAISGVQGDSTASDRLEGYQTGIEEAGGEFLVDEIQYADAVADKAVTSMEAIIQKFPEGIAIIVANNDDMAIGAARAAKDVEAYKDTIFVGFDGNLSAADAILAGDETLSVAQDAYGMGYKAVEAAVKALQGEELDEFIDSGAKIITPDNAKDRKAELQEYLGD